MADGGYVEVVACNFEQGWLLRADGVSGEIRTWLDGHGDETEDYDEARFAIVEWGDGQWSPIELSGPETVQ